MLVMERRPGAGIYIGDSIRVEIRSVRGSKVKIGIDAPRTVRVWRDELDPESVTIAEIDTEIETEVDTAPCGSIGEIDRHESAAPTHTASHLRPQPGHVIVVEDNPAHALIIQSALRQAGVESVTVLSRGEDLIQAMDDGRLGRPSLVMLDLNLPDTSGKDLLRRMRQQPDLRFVPVVMLSCCEHGEEVGECLGEGANAFVTKSTNINDFRNRVNSIAAFWMQTVQVA